MARRNVLKKILACLFIAFFLVILYFPIYWLVTMSFKQRVDIMSVPPKWAFQPTWSNYIWLLEHYNLQNAILNSIVVSLSATFISLLLGIPAAYAGSIPIFS